MIKWVANKLKQKGRHWTILDRDGESPYLERYYILFKDRPAWFPFNAFLHNLKRSDPDDLHDHPWPYLSVILVGGYWEVTPEGRFWRGPGHFRFRSASSLHRLEMDPGVPEVWTLFCPGKRQKRWGFVKNGEWIYYKRYLEERHEQ